MNIEEIKNKKLTPETLMRLGFDENSYADDHWSDLDAYVRIFKLPDNSYQQYFEAEEQHIGKPMQTVGELQQRYNSLTGYELKYYAGDGYPRNQ